MQGEEYLRTSMAPAVKTFQTSFLDGVVAEARQPAAVRLLRAGALSPAAIAQAKSALVQKARDKANGPTLAW